MKPYTARGGRRARGAIGPKKGDHKRCPACIVGGLALDGGADDGRPRFRCARCGNSFTHGKSGEPYFSAIMGFALPAGWRFIETRRRFEHEDGAAISKWPGVARWTVAHPALYRWHKCDAAKEAFDLWASWQVTPASEPA